MAGAPVKQTIAGPIPLAAHLVEALQKAGDRLEVLETLNLWLFDLVSFVTHSRQFRQATGRAQV